MSLAFCSKCSHSENYGRGMYDADMPKPEYCPQCGAKMLHGCASCGAPRRQMSDKFCMKCGKAYKE